MLCSVSTPCFVGLAVALSVSVALHHPALAQEFLEEPGIPQSVGVQLKTPTWNVETIDAAATLGMSTIRRGFYWNVVEAEKGKYDFSKYDEQMALAKEKGLTVVACLFGNNKLYEDDGRGGIQTEAGRSGFANFAAAAAAHYKDHDVLWEVWNEPNVRTFWRKDGKHNSEPFAQEYTDLVKAVMPAVLAVDPDAFVMVGSVSNYWEPSYEWTEFCFQKGILDTGVKAWSVHPYGVKTPEEFAIGHERTRSLLEEYGHPDMIMLNTERGFAVKPLPNNEGWSGGSHERALEFQGWHVVRQQMMDLLYDVRLTVWYEWDGQDKWTGDAFALISGGKKRPAYIAMETMIRELSGYRLVRRLDADHKLDYVVLFENGEGARKLVAWTAPVPGGPPDEAKPHPVLIEAGGSLATTSVSGDAGTMTPGIAVQLTGAPQYISLPEGMDPGRVIVLAMPQAAPAVQLAAPTSVPGAADLMLFEPGVDWEFVRNTGQGSFELGEDSDGKRIGTLAYDFTNSTSRRKPYVLVRTDIEVGEGADTLRLHVRTPIAQQLTLRVVDKTGQTHQFKTRLKGTGTWETVNIPLTRRLEHWGGAKDGTKHFPLQKLLISVPQPSDDQKQGQIEITDVLVIGGSSASSAAAPTQARSAPPRPAARPTSSAPPAAPISGANDLKLFEPGTQWTFKRNTGQGSFDLGKDANGTPVGTLTYDFSNSKSQRTPYVLAEADVNIGEGGSALVFQVRSDVAQQLTFRVNDSTGQKHQFKKRIKGTGGWETLSIPLTRRLEHWGGAKDGKIHYPIQKVTLSVPQPRKDHLQGKVDYAQAVVK